MAKTATPLRIGSRGCAHIARQTCQAQGCCHEFNFLKALSSCEALLAGRARTGRLVAL
jgi:hypothetical protein